MEASVIMRSAQRKRGWGFWGSGIEGREFFNNKAGLQSSGEYVSLQSVKVLYTALGVVSLQLQGDKLTLTIRLHQS